MSRDPERLTDIVSSARLILTYVEGVQREQFIRDTRLQDSVIRRIEIIGEAARRLQTRRRPRTLAGMAKTRTTRRPRQRETYSVPPPQRAPEFPGCKPVHLSREQLADSDQRLEYWDGRTETAWICEPATPYHEQRSRLLNALVERIAQVRGAPIKNYGSMDLREQDAPHSIMQADESLYLHPGRARLPGPSAMVIGVDDHPDVVLEVDHTTDVRRGKLALYESWGFPEVWVEVPDEPSPSRPRPRRPGLTIHLLEDGAYRTAQESRAFPGWTAEEIHAALNEWTLSERTSAVLERVGTVLGEREGTGPDHDPLLRSHRRREFERGVERGIERGRVEELCRLAALRFDEDTAQRLAALLDQAEPERFEQAGLGIFECKTGAELLARLAGQDPGRG